MKKKLVILSSISAACLGAIGVGAAYKATDGMLFAGAATGNVWVHYAKKAATKTEKGIREYWVNCQTNEHVFVAPVGATIQEGTKYDTSAFTEDDDRWILPVSLAAQDVLMTAEKKVLNLGDYAGGTITSMKAGSFDLGTNASDLDVSAFANDHKNDGFYTVEVETVKDDKAYAIYADTTFVTAKISSIEDYLTYIVPEKGVSKFGYYKLANSKIDVNGKITYLSLADYFGGTLDGDGQTITCPSNGKYGLVGNLKFATIKNLTIKDIWYNGSHNCVLLGTYVYQTTLENVTTQITNGSPGLKTAGGGSPELFAPGTLDKDGKNMGACGYLAHNTFQANTIKNCTFDASGWKIGSLFGWNQNMTVPSATNSVVKAASLMQLMHSNYKQKIYQPENVTLKEGEEAIKGLTFVQA